MDKFKLLLVLWVAVILVVSVSGKRQETIGKTESRKINDLIFKFQLKNSEQKLDNLEVNYHMQMVLRYRERWQKLLRSEDSPEVGILTQVDVILEKLDLPSDYTSPSIEEESFFISIDENIKVRFECKGYVSFLRALETFTRLINKEGKINSLPLTIRDQPSLAWRGLSIDTARYFQPLEELKKIIQGMQITKLNIFHWHLTDSESFPLQLLKNPNVTTKGAYSSSEIYSQAEISEFIQYASIRGVIVVPEIDQPAHVRSWTLLPEYQEINTCFNYPLSQWAKYCNQPPCGQLDPSLNKTYELAGSILQEVQNLFPSSYLHLGGDEVNYNCWDFSQKLKIWMSQKGIKDYGQLFNYYFQNLQSYISPNKTQILWFNGQDGVTYQNSTIIQFWGAQNEYDKLKKFTNKVILSTYDFLYLDCGAGNILGDNSWCDPYKTWSRIYSFNPLAAQLGDRLLGVEAALWTELVPSDTIQFKLWPRASALALRLWNLEENLSRPKLVEQLVYVNNIMLNLGIDVGPVSNEYCEKNINMCFF